MYRIVQKLVESKAANGGRVPYGYFTELLDGGISMDFNLGYVMPNNSETSDVSPLTISSTIANLTSDSDPSPELQLLTRMHV